MASDLVALQLILQYWTSNFPGWGLSLIFWVLLILANIVTVRLYGEVGDDLSAILAMSTDGNFQLEYWLSLLKVITIIVRLK